MALPKIILGIDPGLTGGIAVIENGIPITVHDMPGFTKVNAKGKKSNFVQPRQLFQLIENLNPDAIVLEQVHSMPGQGVASMFKFGLAYGICQGAAGGVPTILVTPQTWKKPFSLIGKEKDEARLLMLHMYPELKPLLKRKKDLGRADALLIGMWYSNLSEADRKYHLGETYRDQSI